MRPDSLFFGRAFITGCLGAFEKEPVWRDLFTICGTPAATVKKGFERVRDSVKALPRPRHNFPSQLKTKLHVNHTSQF